MVRNEIPKDQSVLIKKYANRRLYNTATASFVTLSDLHEMVKRGEDFVVQDARTGKDLTSSVLAQIIAEEESKGCNLFPTNYLRQTLKLHSEGMGPELSSYLERSVESFSTNHSQIKQKAKKMDNLPLLFFDDIAENMSGEICKTITDEDIRTFATLTGDINPLHLDDEYARTSVFGERICHGMLIAGLISAVFGSVFPGPGWVYVKQTLRFKAAVHIGDEVTARVVASKLMGRTKLVEFQTECRVGETVVLIGQATLLSPKKPELAGIGPELD